MQAKMMALRLVFVACLIVDLLWPPVCWLSIWVAELSLS